jgi:putative ABC transport system permease protein
MPGYFQAMRLPVLQGRAITGADDDHAPGVVMINERAAARYWPGEDPIGKRISFDADKHDPPTWLTIIGVVKDAAQYYWTSQPDPEVYLAALQNRDFLGYTDSQISYLTLVVRTAGDPAEMTPVVKKTVWSFDHNLPISQVFTMDRVVADATARFRFELLLLGLFAAVALVLAAIGIYGVMNYSVCRRTHEIGIRMSLGARRADVLWMLLRQGLLQALAGTAAGLAGALLFSRLMAGMLYGVRSRDPLTFGGVATVLVLAAILAVCIPARRASRIEPMKALRNE